MNKDKLPKPPIDNSIDDSNRFKKKPKFTPVEQTRKDIEDALKKLRNNK
jgi:hypothetical protein